MSIAIRNLLLGLLLAVPLAAISGCGQGQDTDELAAEEAPAINLEHRYGFVSIVDGTMGVVDLETMSVVNRVKESHRASHMLHVLPGQRDVYYGNWDTNQVLKLHFSEDMKEYEVAERLDSPVQMHGFMTLPPDDRYLIVFSRLELQSGVLFTPEYNDENIARYDYVTGEWQELQLQSPSFGTLGPDGRLYVANVHHQSVSIVDLDTFTEVERVHVGRDEWPSGNASIGPKQIAFSPDGRTMVTADYEGTTISVFDVTANGLENKRLVDFEGTPKSIEFTDDGQDMWVVTYDLNVPREELFAADNMGTWASMGEWYEGPEPANESANAYRRTTMNVLDAESLTQLGQFTTPKAMISPRMSPEAPNLVYVTTSAGSIYSIDRTSYRLMGEAVVGRVGLPVICGNLSL